jgi:hypothetical protein
MQDMDMQKTAPMATIRIPEPVEGSQPALEPAGPDLST